MYSVEDLLLSHGYTLPSSTHDAPERKRDLGSYCGNARNKPGHGTANGCSRADPGAVPLKRGYSIESEGRPSSQAGLRCHAPSPSSDAAGEPARCTSEVGSYGSVPLRWSSRPKTDKDIAYWRRRGQDFSVLLGNTVQGDTESKDISTAKPKSIALPNGECRRTNDNLFQVGNGTRQVVRKNVSQEDDPAASVDYPPQGSKIGTWQHLMKSQKQMANNAEAKLPFQESYSARSGRDASCSQYKQKSNSLPKVLSAENLRPLYLPMPQSHNSFPRNTNMITYAKKDISLDMNKKAKTVSNFPNLPNTRYSRPSKPPSYQLHQQTRQTVEVSNYQCEQHIEEPGTFLDSKSEATHDFNSEESCVEPPVYVAPPSYRSQPDQYLGDTADRERCDYGTCFSDGQLQSCLEGSTIKVQDPTYDFETVGKESSDNPISFQKAKPSDCVNHLPSSVEYIPFDDPRIRHLKLGYEESHQNNPKVRANASVASYATLQDRPLSGVHKTGAHVGEQCLPSNAIPSTEAWNSTNSNRCLDTSIPGKTSHRLFDQVNTVRSSNKIAVHNDSKNIQCFWKELCQGDGVSETKVKKVEAETEIQCIASSRKKMNATIFCLVSVPVTTTSSPAEADKNNSDPTQINEKTRDFLGSSPTDLEVQALAGSMTSKSLQGKQEQCCPEEQKQPGDLLLMKPSKHKGVKYSGSWRADQYRQDPVQTAISQKSCTLPYSSSAKFNEHNDKTLDENSAVPTAAMGSKIPSNDYGQNMYTVKGQMCFNPSSKSAFSRTMSADSHLFRPKTCHSQLTRSVSGSANGKDQKTGNKDLVKGETVASCNSAEPFGQFLLKPVSRRPCDAISELEILYKELEDGETGQMEDLLVKEMEQLQEQPVTGIPTSKTDYRSKLSTNYGSESQTNIHGAPTLNPGGVKSRSDSWSSELESKNLHNVSGYEFRLCVDNHRPPSFKSSAQNEVSKINKANLEAESMRHEQYAYSKGPAPPCKILKSKSMNANEIELLSKASFWESSIDEYYTDDRLVSDERQGKLDMSENSHSVTSDSGKRSCSENRNPSHCSEPELNSGLIDGNTELGGNMLDTYQAKQDPLEALENESFQTRASRILGIEVAEDSIIEGKVQRHLLTSELGTLDHKYAETQLHGLLQTKEKCGPNSLVEGEQHSLCENSNSKEETGILSKKFKPTYTFLKFDQVIDDNSSTGNDLASPVLDHDIACQPISLHFDAKKANTGNSDRKPRVTSKVIETLQVKLASTPKRTATDRLVRMTEVHSVSRMRRLSIKRSDSGDEADDEKEQHKAEEEGRSKSTFDNELSHKAMIQPGGVSKRVIFLDGRTPTSAKSNDEIEEDIFYIDSYDPTRVERV